MWWGWRGRPGRAWGLQGRGEGPQSPRGPGQPWDRCLEGHLSEFTRTAYPTVCACAHTSSSSAAKPGVGA